MKHNNVIPNAHFHKEWQKFVKTWFDQPSRKERRREVRKHRSIRLAPRPTQLLRPIVRNPTQRYNNKIRGGRGFSLSELKAIGLNRRAALGIGVSIDHRRRNRNEEGFNLNVNRLKSFKSKLILFPRKPTSKRAKKGDSSKDEIKSAKQNDVMDVLPIDNSLVDRKVKARLIQKDEKSKDIRKIQGRALADQKLWGQRMKKREEKEAEKAGKAKKQNKEEANVEDE